VYFAAELRILLAYLSESLGRLGQNGGPHFSLGEGGRGPPGPRRTAPASDRSPRPLSIQTALTPACTRGPVYKRDPASVSIQITHVHSINFVYISSPAFVRLTGPQSKARRFCDNFMKYSTNRFSKFFHCHSQQ